MIGVYKITSPTGRIYIGSSINIRKRFTYYKRLDCKAQVRLYNSLNKYGADKHTFEIMCECSKEDLYKNESYFGTLFNVLGKGGLNNRIPKHGEHFRSTSERTCKNISLGKIGTIQTKEHIEKCRLTRIGKRKSTECKKKMSDAAMGGKNHKAVILLNTNTGIFYECFQDAAFSMGMNYNTFRSRMYHRRPMPFIL